VGLPGLNDAGKAAASRLRRLQEQGKIRDWAAVSSDLDQLLDALAR
jgi:hypothetical protein